MTKMATETTATPVEHLKTTLRATQARAQEKYAEALTVFQINLSGNPHYAITWRADGVVRLQAVSELVTEFVDYACGKETFAEMLEAADSYIAHKRRRFDGFTVPSSTSRFTNACDIAAMEAEADALSSSGVLADCRYEIEQHLQANVT